MLSAEQCFDASCPRCFVLCCLSLVEHGSIAESFWLFFKQGEQLVVDPTHLADAGIVDVRDLLKQWLEIVESVAGKLVEPEVGDVPDAFAAAFHLGKIWFFLVDGKQDAIQEQQQVGYGVLPDMGFCVVVVGCHPRMPLCVRFFGTYVRRYSNACWGVSTAAKSPSLGSAMPTWTAFANCLSRSS